MPGKRENVQLMINADVENIIGNKRVITQKNYGPFKMEMPKMSKRILTSLWLTPYYSTTLTFYQHRL